VAESVDVIAGFGSAAPVAVPTRYIGRPIIDA
jgi:putative transposon-encoded protein